MFTANSLYRCNGGEQAWRRRVWMLILRKPHPHSNQEVWWHFGFPKTKNDSGEVVDKTKTVCKHCKKTFTYINSTTNMMQHINRHHSEKLQSQPSVCKTPLIGQTTLTGGFAAPLAPTSARAAAIIRCICVFMGKDMRPFYVVENEGFRLLVNTLEPRYQIPSRPHFSQTVMPTLYRETKSKVVEAERQTCQLQPTAGPPGLPRDVLRSHSPCDNQQVGGGQFCPSNSPSV